MNIFNQRIIHLLIIISSIALVFININTNNIIDVTSILFGEWAVNAADIGNILFLISIGVLFTLIIRYLYLETKYRTEVLIAESSKKYIQELEEAYKAMRIIKHDYLNIMTSLKLRIDNGDIAGLVKYYDEELSKLNNDLLNQDQLIASLYNIQINEVKSILVYKCSAAAQYGIEIYIEATELIDKLGISTAVICQILGILLDNAIEAIAETKDQHTPQSSGVCCSVKNGFYAGLLNPLANKKLNIAIIKNPNSKIFIIKNTWKRKEITIDNLFELGFSTKGKGRGIGLHTVRNYTEKMTRLYLETEIDDIYFTQILSVKDNK
jgi:two-component system sensor histidine kinase AgrC